MKTERVRRERLLWIAPGEQLDRPARRADELTRHLARESRLVRVTNRAPSDPGDRRHERQRHEQETDCADGDRDARSVAPPPAPPGRGSEQPESTTPVRPEEQGRRDQRACRQPDELRLPPDLDERAIRERGGCKRNRCPRDRRPDQQEHRAYKRIAGEQPADPRKARAGPSALRTRRRRSGVVVARASGCDRRTPPGRGAGGCGSPRGSPRSLATPPVRTRRIRPQLQERPARGRAPATARMPRPPHRTCRRSRRGWPRRPRKRSLRRSTPPYLRRHRRASSV